MNNPVLRKHKQFSGYEKKTPWNCPQCKTHFTDKEEQPDYHFMGRTVCLSCGSKLAEYVEKNIRKNEPHVFSAFGFNF